MKRIVIMSLTVLIPFLILSCASAPEEKPETPEEVLEEEPEFPVPEDERERAQKLRDLIQKYEFSQYAENEFSEGEAAYSQAEEMLESDNQAAKENYSDAVTSYNQVIEISMQTLYEKWENELETQFDEAEEVKASKAVPDKYSAAEKKIEDARTAYEAEDYEQAVSLYREGTDELEDAVAEAREKRERAREALREMDSNFEETQKRLEDFAQDVESFDPESDEDVPEEGTEEPDEDDS